MTINKNDTEGISFPRTPSGRMYVGKVCIVVDVVVVGGRGEYDECCEIGRGTKNSNWLP